MRVRSIWISTLTAVGLAGTLALSGCAVEARSDAVTPRPTQGGVEAGTLVFVADGEEHAREGTVSKEGWSITFEHAYVTLAGITAYQTDPPYDVDADGWDLEYVQKVSLPGEITVDLADPASDPAVVGEAPDAPAGFYNAFSWHVVRAAGGLAEGYSMVFIGTAERGDETVDFTLRIDRELAYQGGEYIGDVRKGILEPAGRGEAEMTFHFDHFFGSADKDADDPLNMAALGFDPLAALATNGVIDVNLGDLSELLSAEDYARLEDILVHFGHVGEGHCIARPLE